MNIQENNLTLYNKNSSMIHNCAVYSEWDKYLVDKLEFYVEGVVVCCIALPGLFANISMLFMLIVQKSTKNIFNSLLICLFLFDSLILFIGLIWSFQTYFDISSNIQIILFPVLVHPLKNMSMTASIFMTVAIAHERYAAIKEPMLCRQMIANSDIRKRHLIKYVFLIVCASVAFNIPKFFESEVKWIHAPEKIPKPHHAVDENILR